jgi:hypothetical protein
MAQVAAVETVPGTVEDVPTRLLLAYQGKDPEKRKYFWFSFLLLYIYGSVFYFYFGGTKQDIGLGCKHMYCIYRCVNHRGSPLENIRNYIEGKTNIFFPQKPQMHKCSH